ncbi:hypothetical protein [Hymenobacter cellulosilyticus]|uniref:hypothetical protein n=1 Tax=Hymenobacter cellulosilyticus TaxID=2932248 RepID=UPI0028808307|nr:hypothetical protein [Hymenobacter cellulosilyticus]
MKTYLRILQYARPLANTVPLYLLYTIFGIFFGIGNLALVIPMLNVLFETTNKLSAPLACPSLPSPSTTSRARSTTFLPR